VDVAEIADKIDNVIGVRIPEADPDGGAVDVAVFPAVFGVGVHGGHLLGNFAGPWGGPGFW
jgi:hypothetical protein